MLDTNLQTQLKSYLENLKTPVELITFTDESPKAKELAQLVDQIIELSPLVSKIDGNNTFSKAEQANNERVPSMLVRSVETGSEMRFAGLPMGHEFTSLVMALLHSGSHPLKIDAEQIEQMRNLEGSFEFETYISLSCQNCPDVVQALNMMAAINSNIKHTMIDGALFQTEVFDRDVMAVPNVFLNGESFAQGRISLTDILNNPHVESSKLSGGNELYKIKLRQVGYQLMYEVNDAMITVTVISVGKRNTGKIYKAAMDRTS